MYVCVCVCVCVCMNNIEQYLIIRQYFAFH